MMFDSQSPLEASDDEAEIVLADATDGRAAGRVRRLVAKRRRFDPDEGLALLDAYVSITDASVRQAILDIVQAIAGTKPDRRARPSPPTRRGNS